MEPTASTDTSRGAPVVVTGCYAERAGDVMIRDPQVQVVPNARKHEAANAILTALQNHEPHTGPADADRGAAPVSSARTRAFIKIQEGCDDVCAFCIVPHVRGRERAIPIAEIVSTVRERIDGGIQEIVLTRTQPGAYGRDRSNGSAAATLVEALIAQTDAPRIRYSSIQPQDITPQLLAGWDDARACRHVHLALQSGANAILSRMRRRYTSTEFRDAVAAFRASVPGISITTDIIAGFSGETESDHQATLSLMREVRFTNVHVFPYSSRPNTSAARLDDDVPAEIKRVRAAELRELGAIHRRIALDAGIGSLHSVLFEHRSTRLTDSYLPSRLDADANLTNQIRSVRVIASDGQRLIGELAG